MIDYSHRQQIAIVDKLHELGFWSSLQQEVFKLAQAGWIHVPVGMLRVDIPFVKRKMPWIIFGLTNVDRQVLVARHNSLLALAEPKVGHWNADRNASTASLAFGLVVMIATTTEAIKRQSGIGLEIDFCRWIDKYRGSETSVEITALVLGRSEVD